MRVILAAVMVTLLATTAFAQSDHVQGYREKDKEKSQTEIQAEKDAERAYKRSLGNIPDQGPTDPWGVVRPTDAPKSATPAAKPSKPKTKTGAAAN